MAEPTPTRRRTFGPVVLVGLAAAALAAVAGDKPAVEGDGRRASAFSSLTLTFDAHMPLVTALALVVLAAWGVVLVTRGRVRRAIALLGSLAADGVVVAVVAAYLQVPDQYREELAQVGVTDAEVGHTAWFWAAAVGAVVGSVCAALAVAWVPQWPEMGGRYDAPAAGSGPGGAAEDQTSLDLWKAMDEGRDPTTDHPE